MAEEHPNLLRLRRSLHAFNKGDLEAAKEVFSETLVYYVAGKSLIAGEYYGIDQFFALLQRVKALSGGTLTLTPQIMLGDDKAIMMYVHATARREGKMLDIEQAYYYRFGENNKIVEGRTIPVDLYAFDEFWS